MLTGHFRIETPDGYTLVSAEDEANRLYTARLTAPRVLTADEVNERSRMFSTILGAPGPVSRLHRDRLYALWVDLMMHAAAVRNAAEGK